MRLAGRRDGNHGEIRDGLRDCGWKVEDLGGLGGGVPDLLVGAAGVNILLEVKVPGGKLTGDEPDWHDAWRGQVDVVESLEAAIAVVEREVARRGSRN